MLTAADITSIRVSHDNIESQMDAMQTELQDLVYAISHDLGAPLRAITGFSSILNKKCGHALDEKGQTYLRFISEGGEKAQLMLAGLLRYSRVVTQAKPFKHVSLSSVLNVVLSELDEKISTKLARVHFEFLPPVWADEEQMRQMFSVIIDNALTYHRAGMPPHIIVGAEEHKNFWHITVTDNGLGVPSDQADRIFDVFKRLHEDVTPPAAGMGLAIARRIVERHGGTIGITSAPDFGAVVCITLPKNYAPETTETTHTTETEV
jgi:light-regulated signal transduction histidine kinase (bacteriophytochrome)